MRATLRVVRRKSRTPSRASSCATWLETAARDKPSNLAAALKLDAAATALKVRIRWMLSAMARIGGGALSIFYELC